MHGKWGRSLLAVLLAGAALLGLAGCHRDTPLGKSFRFPLSAEPRQLDPQVSTDAASVTLVAALFVQLVMTFVQNKEELFLDDCADYCHRNLIAKMKNVNLIEPEA